MILLWILSCCWSMCSVRCSSGIKQIGLWNYQASGDVAAFECFYGRKRFSSCASLCVGYRLGYTLVFWVIEKNKMETSPLPFLFLCKRSCRKVSLMQWKDHWWLSTIRRTLSVSSLLITYTNGNHTPLEARAMGSLQEKVILLPG